MSRLYRGSEYDVYKHPNMSDYDEVDFKECQHTRNRNIGKLRVGMTVAFGRPSAMESISECDRFADSIGNAEFDRYGQKYGQRKQIIHSRRLKMVSQNDMDY